MVIADQHMPMFTFYQHALARMHPQQRMIIHINSITQSLRFMLAAQVGYYLPFQIYQILLPDKARRRKELLRELGSFLHILLPNLVGALVISRASHAYLGIGTNYLLVSRNRGIVTTTSTAQYAFGLPLAIIPKRSYLIQVHTRAISTYSARISDFVDEGDRPQTVWYSGNLSYAQQVVNDMRQMGAVNFADLNHPDDLVLTPENESTARKLR